MGYFSKKKKKKKKKKGIWYTGTPFQGLYHSAFQYATYKFTNQTARMQSWFVSLLFANPEERFSGIEAHIEPNDEISIAMACAPQ